MTRVRRALVGVAAVLGVAALAAGDPLPGGGGRVGAVVAAAGERVPTLGAVELARRLRDRTPGLRVADLRDSASFALFRLPGSERTDLPTLLAETPPAGPETLVLVDEGLDAAAAWPILRAGGRDAVVLDGGVNAWIAQILSPVLPAFADTVLTARFAEVAELSRYFGGEPRVAEAGEGVTTPWAAADTASLESHVERLRARGGCGW